MTLAATILKFTLCEGPLKSNQDTIQSYISVVLNGISLLTFREAFISLKFSYQVNCLSTCAAKKGRRKVGKKEANV